MYNNYPDVYKKYYEQTHMDKRNREYLILDKESDFYEKLRLIHSYRYDSRDDKRSNVKDFFMRGLVLSTSFKKIKKSNAKSKEIYDEVLECWKFDELKNNMDDSDFVTAYFNEFYNMVAFYIELCQKDKGYTSSMMGLMRLSDDKLENKIGHDILEIFYRVPRLFDRFDDTKLLREAAKKAFYDEYESSKLLDAGSIS